MTYTAVYCYLEVELGDPSFCGYIPNKLNSLLKWTLSVRSIELFSSSLMRVVLSVLICIGFRFALHL